MRQQDKIIIWPVYFDSTKTRNDGRRIPKSLAVVSPKIPEIREATEQLRLEYELVADAGYAKIPTVKTGMLLVKKRGPKGEIIKEIAEQLLINRNAMPKQQDRKG
jgi:signal recognition particle subunit SRP19